MVKKKTNSRILEKKPGRLKIGVRVSLFNIHPASESHEEYSHHQRYRPAMI